VLVNREVLGISMNLRRNRRLLAVAIYSFLALLFLLLVRHRVSGIGVFLTIVIVVNPLVFGEFLFWGKKYGGLLKPFEPDSERPNDEREVSTRDFAHFRAYGWMRFLITAVAVLPDLLPARVMEHVTPTELLYVIRTVIWGLLALSLTLPQSILLWTEPDIDFDSEEKLRLSVPNHSR
jgi:hypothetical protein